MCHFNYKKFDTCGDYGIEISHVCDQALWQAGLRGVLQVCVPRILERSLEWSGRDDHEPPKPARFRGYDGFCEMCVTRFKLPCSILQRSYSDHELDYSRPSTSFNPDDLAPYILFGGIFAQIPELLGLSDQFEAAQMRQGPHLIFHKSLERGTWSRLRRALPFTFQGELQNDCTLDLDGAMKRLNIDLGITEYDKDLLVHALQHDPPPRVVYNRLFRHRGMPLGHFSISIVNCCQRAVSLIRAQEATADKKSSEHHTEYSDDSTLTTLTNTPVLSDVEPAAPHTPPHGSELSDTPDYDGSSSIPHELRTVRASQAASPGEQSTVVRNTLTTISAAQKASPSTGLSSKICASVIHPLATGSPLSQPDDVVVEPAQGNSGLGGGEDSKLSARVAELEQQSTADRVNRPRRMAIAGQRADEWRLRPLTQGVESSDETNPALGKLGRELGLIKPEPQKRSTDSPKRPGNGISAAVSYYEPGRVFKWKVLEGPAHKWTRNVSRAAGSQERTDCGGQVRSPQMLAANQAPTAQQSPAQKRPTRARRPATHQGDAVFISIDSEGDVKM